MQYQTQYLEQKILDIAGLNFESFGESENPGNQTDERAYSEINENNQTNDLLLSKNRKYRMSLQNNDKRKTRHFQLESLTEKDSDYNIKNLKEDNSNFYGSVQSYESEIVSITARLPILISDPSTGKTTYTSQWLTMIEFMLKTEDLKRVKTVGYYEKLEIYSKSHISAFNYVHLPKNFQETYKVQMEMVGMVIEDINIDEDVMEGLHTVADITSKEAYEDLSNADLDFYIKVYCPTYAMFRVNSIE